MNIQRLIALLSAQITAQGIDGRMVVTRQDGDEPALTISVGTTSDPGGVSWFRLSVEALDGPPGRS